MANEEISMESDALILATNRTTHAVRAIAILFLYNIPWLVAAGLAYAFTFRIAASSGSNEGVLSGTLLSAAIVVIGQISTLVMAFAELRKSKVW